MTLVSTEAAAKATGLSTYELRRGWKEGRYPALVIGRSEERQRLRWDLDRLTSAIAKQMGDGPR